MKDNRIKSKLRKKFAIISSCDAKYGDFLVKSWIGSLKANVNLENIDIIILDYGLNKNQKKNLKTEGVKIVPCKRTGHIVNTRYKDMLNFLKTHKYEQILSCDGGDIIFQTDISPLFYKNKNSYRGVYEEVQKIEFFSIFMKKFEHKTKEKILRQLKDKKIINGGLILAPYKKFITLCEKIDKMVKNKNDYGPDMIMLNYALQGENFFPLKKEFNFIPTTSNEKFEIRKGTFYNKRGEIIPIVHNSGGSPILRVVKNFGYGEGYNRLSVTLYYSLKFFFKVMTTYYSLFSKD